MIIVEHYSGEHFERLMKRLRHASSNLSALRRYQAYHLSSRQKRQLKRELFRKNKKLFKPRYFNKNNFFVRNNQQNTDSRSVNQQ